MAELDFPPHSITSRFIPARTEWILVLPWATRVFDSEEAADKAFIEEMRQYGAILDDIDAPDSVVEIIEDGGEYRTAMQPPLPDFPRA